METWFLWEQYREAIDKVPTRAVKTVVRNNADAAKADLRLDREATVNKVSRFLSAIKRMPRAWGGKEWTQKQLKQANQLTVENDMFRRRMKRELGLR